MSRKHVIDIFSFATQNKDPSHVYTVQSIVTNTQERRGGPGEWGSVFVTIFRYNNARTLPTHNENGNLIYTEDDYESLNGAYKSTVFS